MKEKEIAEIRRRLHPERHSITKIFGCYVNEEGQILTTFAQSLGLMPADEAEKYLGLFKRSLSGTLNKNLLEITFTTAQVADSPEHRRLMALRKEQLKDEDALRAFYEAVIATAPLEGNYLILMLHNSYDVPFKRRDGSVDQDSGNVYSYIQCCICPVKLTKSALAYKASISEFHSSEPGWVVSPPELGFLFPAFDDRAANLYNALYYTKSAEENHEAFVAAVFNAPLPMPAAAQKSTFQAVVGNALETDCTYEAVRTIHDGLCQLIAVHRESRTPEPLTLTCGEVQELLEGSRVPEERLTTLGEKLKSEFGDADLSPKNLIDHKKLEVVTPEVSIKVSPEGSDLIETRVLGGVKYILIRAEESVEVNGVPICIQDI